MLFEILRVTTGIAATVLWEKDAVGVIGPARAGASDIRRPEALRERTRPVGATDVLDEAAHDPSVPRAAPRQEKESRIFSPARSPGTARRSPRSTAMSALRA